MKKDNVRDRLFATTVIAGLAFGLGGAAAQTAAPTPAPKPDTASSAEEEIVVTGSLIRRSAETAPSPLIQIGKEELKQRGEINLVDALADIPALQNSQVYEDTTGGFVGIGGLAFLNLRNLGSGRTLVLVDGRRHVAGDPGGAAVDVDTIPSTLIERVEVITGGASALYGADAVSGVVNFILRDDYEGFEAEAAVGQLVQGSDKTARRISGTWGGNFLDDRLNLYAFGEYQTTERIDDNELDIKYLNRNIRLQTTDADPGSAPDDGVLDVTRVGNIRSLNRPIGGALTLANGQFASPAGDPDIVTATCTAANVGSLAAQGGCFNVNPGRTFQFRPDGTGYLADFGFGQFQAGASNRNLTVGGSGEDLRTAAGDINRLPEQDNKRFQVGANFDLTPDIQIFSELKYVTEKNIDVFQPHFANILLANMGTTPSALNTLTDYTISLDNAYLDPAVRAAILANTRNNVTSSAQTGPLTTGATSTDPRALYRLFSYGLGDRPSIAERETTRFVGGVRGQADDFFGVVKDVNWEVGFTYGRMEATNTEPDTIDVDRYIFSADAVRDTAGLVGPAGNIVCRVRILNAQGVPIINSSTGSAYANNDPTITGCVPSNIFAANGFQSSRGYINTKLTTVDINEQYDTKVFVSGSLWDLWGAGPLGFAIGGEYRNEATSSDLTEFGNRTLFANAGGDLKEVNFNVAESFLELRVPVLKNMPFAKDLEFNGAARTSNYSSIGSEDTYSAAVFWRVNDDIAFRGSNGSSVRAPTLGLLFDPPGQTFPNLTDGCSQPVINSTASATIRANRIRNCATIGVPTTYVDPNPTQSNTGLSGSNPLLKSEESYSNTISAIITPTALPGLSIVFDYYDIEISNAIATLSAQTLLNLCTDSDQFNAAACGVFTRAPASATNAFEIVNFIEGPFNFAGLKAKGVDFQARYSFDSEDVFGINFGSVDLGLAGNYLIKRQNFTNPSVPNAATNVDTTAENPRVRLATSATVTNGPLAVSWRMDYISSQELVNVRALGANTDNREVKYMETDDFFQHDISARYELNDNVSIRGGVNNVFDAEPNVQTGLTDLFDLYGRRIFASVNVRY